MDNNVILGKKPNISKKLILKTQKKLKMIRTKILIWLCYNSHILINNLQIIYKKNNNNTNNN